MRTHRERRAELTASLDAKRERVSALRRELAGLPEVNAAARPRARAFTWALALFALAFWWLALRTRAEPPRALADVARRDALAADLDRATRTRVMPAPAPAPSGFPALSSARALPGGDDESSLGWAQIALAACTTKESDLARWAFRRLEMRGRESTARADAAAMPPALSAVIRQVDEHCREQGLHLFGS